MAFNIGFQPEKKSYLLNENGFEEMNDKDSYDRDISSDKPPALLQS